MKIDDIRIRIEFGVMGLMKAIREDDEDEQKRHAANLLADVLTSIGSIAVGVVNTHATLERIADALDNIAAHMPDDRK